MNYPILRLCGLMFASACALIAAAVPVKNDTKLTGDYYTTDKVSQKPVAVKLPSPSYPQKWRDEPSVRGVAEVVFIVNEKGRTEEVQVATATDVEFGNAAAAAVKNWRFKPALKDGKPVRVALLQKIEFTIDH